MRVLGELKHTYHQTLDPDGTPLDIPPIMILLMAEWKVLPVLRCSLEGTQ